jgi:hypothetical protein
MMPIDEAHGEAHGADCLSSVAGSAVRHTLHLALLLSTVNATTSALGIALAAALDRLDHVRGVEQHLVAVLASLARVDPAHWHAQRVVQRHHHELVHASHELQGLERH